MHGRGIPCSELTMADDDDYDDDDYDDDDDVDDDDIYTYLFISIKTYFIIIIVLRRENVSHSGYFLLTALRQC
jgi:hypothetical protein